MFSWFKQLMVAVMFLSALTVAPMSASAVATSSDLQGLWVFEHSFRLERTIAIGHSDRKYGTIAWSPSGDQIAVFYRGVSIVNLGTGAMKDVSELGTSAESGAWSPTGDRLLVSTGDKGLAIYDTITGKSTFIPESVTGDVYANAQVGWHPSGKAITYNSDGIYLLGEDNKPQKVAERGRAFQWSADGKKLYALDAVQYRDSSVETKDGGPFSVVRAQIKSGYSGDFYTPAMSPDQRFVVYGAATGMIGYGQVYMNAMPNPDETLPPEAGSVMILDMDKLGAGANMSGLAWSPDGTRLAVNRNDGTLDIYKVTPAPGPTFTVKVDPRMIPGYRDHFQVTTAVEERSVVTGAVISTKDEAAGWARIESVGADGTLKIVLTLSEGAPVPKQAEVEKALTAALEPVYLAKAKALILGLPTNGVRAEQVLRAKELVTNYGLLWPSGQFSSFIQRLNTEEIGYRGALLKVQAAQSAIVKQQALQDYMASVTPGQAHFDEAKAQVAALEPAAKLERAAAAYTKLKSDLSTKAPNEQVKLLSALAEEYPEAPFVPEVRQAIANLMTSLAPQKLQPDVLPIVYNGTTLVPVRALTEWLGATVKFDSDTQTIQIQKADRSVVLQLNSARAYVGSAEKVLALPAVSVRGRTMVPARFIAESFGVEVKWNGDTNEILFTADNGKATLYVPTPQAVDLQAIDIALTQPKREFGFIGMVTVTTAIGNQDEPHNQVTRLKQDESALWVAVQSESTDMVLVSVRWYRDGSFVRKDSQASAWVGQWNAFSLKEGLWDQTRPEAGSYTALLYVGGSLRGQATFVVDEPSRRGS